MPSHLAPLPAAGGGATGAQDEPRAATTRRAMRAQREALGEVGPLPGVEELMAADAALVGADGAGLVPAHPGVGRGGAPAGRGPARSPSPAADRSAVTVPGAVPPSLPGLAAGRSTPAPMTRREARERAEAASHRALPVLAAPQGPAPAGDVAATGGALPPAGAASVGAGSAGAVRGGALALAERPAPPAAPPERLGWCWDARDLGDAMGFTAELELSGLRHLPAPAADGVIVLPPTPLMDAHGAPPAPLTRRARREIEELERSLALPAASPARPRERHLMTVVLSPEGDLASDMHAIPVVAGPGGRRGRRGTTGRSAFGLPQAGVVGVLGLAVLVGPSLGQVAHADSVPVPVPTSLPSLPPTPIGAVADLPATAASATVVPSLAPGEAVPPRAEELLAKREQAEQASRAIGERTLAAEATVRAAAEREAAAAALVPGCDGQVGAAVMRASNGQLPDADLCVLWDGDERLRPDAALAMARLDLAYRDAFGEDIPVSDAYRSYGSQVEVRRTKPGLAARPGTSQHGWGVAVDLGGNIANGGDRYVWLMEHAGEFGWENPAWARPGGGGPHEPWHWEYAAGRGLAHTG